jgi:hypothetical protein
LIGNELKVATGASTSSQITLPIDEDLEFAAQPLGILDIRVTPTRTKDILVSWDGLDPADAKWKDSKTFFAAYLVVHLEDKVKVLAGGIVTNGQPGKPVLITYQRRNKKRGTAGK